MDKYLLRFNEFMENGYDKKENEKIVQCLSTENDGLYYNPAWFVSNEGYVLSVARKEPKILKPSIKFGGKKSNCENKITEFVKGYGQRIPVGMTPQYYFYKNSYGKKPSKVVPMHKLIAHYFADDFREENEAYGDVHHKQAMDWNKTPQENNKAENLQVVPPILHHEVTGCSKLSDEMLEKQIGEVRALKHKEVIVTKEEMEMFLEQIFNMQVLGTRFLVAYCDDEGQVFKTEVHKMV